MTKLIKPIEIVIALAVMVSGAVYGFRRFALRTSEILSQDAVEEEPVPDVS